MNDFGITILSLSVSGSILALFFLLTKPLVKKKLSKTFSYYVWLLVLLRLVVPVTLPVNITGGLYQVGHSAVNMNMQPIISDHENPDTPPQVGTASAQIQTGENPSGANREGVSQLAPQLWSFIMNNVFGIWLIGMMLSVGWSFASYIVFSKRIRDNCTAPAEEDFAVFCQARGKKRVDFVCSKCAVTPMLIGVLHPVVVLPEGSYVRRGQGKKLRNIFAHELTHYSRRDIIYKWLVVLATSAHWFNPLMILVRKEINRACELSCDEAVIKQMSWEDRRDYGNTLLEFASDHRLHSGILSTTMCEDKRALKDRLLGIKEYHRRPRWIVVLSLALVLILAGCAATLGPAADSNLKEMNQRYAQIVSDLIRFLDNSATDESYNRGALADIDLDSTPELLLLYLDGDYESYKIYNYSNEESTLIDSGQLFANAGAASGGISQVSLGGVQYVCIWSANSEAGQLKHLNYSCRLYRASGQNFSYVHTYDFDYYVDSAGEPLSENGTFKRDGDSISFKDFQSVNAFLLQPEQVYCAVGNDNTVGMTFGKILSSLGD